MLAAGRIDLTLEDEWVAKYYLSHELVELAPALEFLPVELSASPLHILVRRKHPQSAQIVRAFNQALQEMRADGSYASIVRTISASDSTVTYTSADQTTDFGSPPTTLYLDIYQISATVGRGYALRAAV